MAESEVKSLSDDLLIDISERLTSIEDYGSFKSICKSWSAAGSSSKEEEKKKNLKTKTFGVPWLMLAEEEEDSCLGMRGFYSLASGKTRKIFLPETINKRVLSSQDWLFMVSAEDQITTSLLHPISRVQIELPKLSTFPEFQRYSFRFSGTHNTHFISKFVLLGNPNTTESFIVFVIWGVKYQLGYWKPGDTCWTQMDNNQVGFYDMINYNNKLYALDFHKRLVTFDVNGPNPTKLDTVFSLIKSYYEDEAYLVEVSNKLLIVFRYITNIKGARTREFLVSELKVKDGSQYMFWNMGNKAVFLGDNSTFSVECSDVNKCKPNCIYFSDNFYPRYYKLPKGGGHDTGIFNLSYGTIEPIIKNIGCSMLTPPIWIGFNPFSAF